MVNDRHQDSQKTYPRIMWINWWISFYTNAKMAELLSLEQIAYFLGK